MTRGKIRANRFGKLRQAGALKDTAAVDKAISERLASSGKRLPEYQWSNVEGGVLKGRGFDMARGGEGGIKLTNGKVPVYADGGRVLDALARNDGTFSGKLRKSFLRLMGHGGPNYNPIGQFVSLGEKGVLNPEVLMHELGHAADHDAGRLGKFAPSGVMDALSEAWRGMLSPEKTKLLQREISAWENAGIGKGNALREAALDTYRNAARANGVSTYVGTPMALGGLLMRRGEENSGEQQGVYDKLYSRFDNRRSRYHTGMLLDSIRRARQGR
jgi:hypothetical protein